MASSNIVFRVGAKERAALDAAAARAGVKLSEWVRRVIYRAAGLPQKAARMPAGNPAFREPRQGKA